MDKYLDINDRTTFYNQIQSYLYVYKNAESAHKNAHRLFGKDHFKKALEGRVKELSSMSRGDYMIRTAELHKNETNPSVKARYWEMLGKCSNYLRDKELTVHTSNIDIKDLRSVLDKRRELLESPSTE